MINKHSSDAIQPKKKATYDDMEATMIDKLTETAPDEWLADHQATSRILTKKNKEDD